MPFHDACEKTLEHLKRGDTCHLCGKALVPCAYAYVDHACGLTVCCECYSTRRVTTDNAACDRRSGLKNW